MSKRQKTTQAVHKTARLNPIHKLERDVLEVIEYWERNGVNFKQLVVDRIARYDMNLTPEIYVNEVAPDSSTEELLQRYTDYLLEELKTTGVQTGSNEQAQSEGDNGAFSKRLAEGFAARRKKGHGDE